MISIPLSASMRDVSAPPAVRRICLADLKDALIAGLDDFRAAPTHAVFLVIIYPIVGLIIARLTTGENLLPLAYPLTAGFTLLGPLAALGLYDMSRRREQGLDLSWRSAFAIVHRPRWSSIAAVGAVQMLIFIAWVATAQGLYRGLFGQVRPQSVGNLIGLALTTPPGWALIVLGNGIGLLFAVVALTLGVVSFPLLLDRPVSAKVAVTTSIRAVRANIGPMTVWGIIIAASLVIGSVPFFVGLAVVLPILGHASWHLYRRLVVPADEPR